MQTQERSRVICTNIEKSKGSAVILTSDHRQRHGEKGGERRATGPGYDRKEFRRVAPQVNQEFQEKKKELSLTTTER